ncbi:mechanosensitive ion channel family protein [Martelella radicis]|uniref:MscS family membrane protein n=1 Tax=Martelella radicis TaxID=1397476 RepID=A0A7W6KIC9_9HYPH|nr:mechanosensitive ion channel domain-containing protein [Martelella radicis]MBB4121723.1 MscS family membrane protein [Martelella radicis]
MLVLALLFASLSALQPGSVAPAHAQEIRTQPQEEQQATAAELVQEIIDDAGDNEGLKSRYQRLVTNPISPPDTRSPRATLESFLVIMQAANKLWLGVRDEFFANDDFFISPDDKEQLVLVQSLLGKAAQTMDLSGVPAASRERFSIETVLQLQEVFDRIYLPPLDDVPGFPAGSNARTNDLDAPLPDRWIIPGTSLTIALMKEGPQSGQYLFTAATVDEIPDDYEALQSLPIIADKGEDLYQYYIYTPGNLVAPQWYQYVLNGPDWLQSTFGGQAYWQWIALALTVIVLMLALAFYTRWNNRRAVPLDPAARQSRRLAPPILIILAANLFHYLCEEQINITGELLQMLTTVISAIVWTTAAWLTYQVLQTIYLWTIRNPAVNNASLDASLVRTGFRVASFMVAIVVLGYGATRIGIPIYGVVAGLGVGGLAIALAAQPTLENFISGLILYADRIVRVGDFFQFSDTAGTVEEIGIRSTRIRALDRTLIIVANAELVKHKITNYSQRDVFLFRHKVGVRYETDSETLHKVRDGIHAALEAHESVLESPLRVRLVEYGDFAILFDIYANISATDINAFLEVQEELLIAIREVIEGNGASFAFPSSTVYLSRDQLPEQKTVDIVENKSDEERPNGAPEEKAYPVDET